MYSTDIPLEDFLRVYDVGTFELCTRSSEQTSNKPQITPNPRTIELEASYEPNKHTA